MGMTPKQRREARKAKENQQLGFSGSNQEENGAKGLSKEERIGNRDRYYHVMLYKGLVNIKNLIHEAGKVGINVENVSDLDWQDIIEDTKKSGGLTTNDLGFIDV